jgi:hypothetical protein
MMHGEAFPGAIGINRDREEKLNTSDSNRSKSPGYQNNKLVSA